MRLVPEIQAGSSGVARDAFIEEQFSVVIEISWRFVPWFRRDPDIAPSVNIASQARRALSVSALAAFCACKATPPSTESAAWKEVTEQGAFTASFPAEPKKEAAPKGDGATSSEYTAWDARNMYTLRRSADPVYAKLSGQALTTTVDKAIRAKIAHYESKEGGNVVALNDVTLSSHPAKECAVTVAKPMKGTNFTRISVINGAYYDLSVFISAESSAKDEHERFFASFKAAQ